MIKSRNMAFLEKIWERHFAMGNTAQLPKVKKCDIIEEWKANETGRNGR